MRDVKANDFHATTYATPGFAAMLRRDYFIFAAHGRLIIVSSLLIIIYH